MDEFLPRDKKLRARSGELRRNATKEEKHLWYDFLRTYPARFYRQRIIGDYITDFFCYQAKLVVELDGMQHQDPEAREYDRIRSDYLNALGISVIRFTNREVRTNFKAVCGTIHNTAQMRLKNSKSL